MMKTKTWITIVVAVTVMIIFAVNIRYVDYFSKQVLSRHIKEFQTSWQQNGRAGSFDETYQTGDLRLARLELDASWKHVKNIYGAPFRRKVETIESPNNPDYVVYLTSWIYPDFEVRFINSIEKSLPKPKEPGNVFAITVKSNKFQSYRGIRVEDPVSKVIERYGPASNAIIDDRGSKFYEWQLNYIRFGVSKGKVSEIEVSQNPD